MKMHIGGKLGGRAQVGNSLLGRLQFTDCPSRTDEGVEVGERQGSGFRLLPVNRNSGWTPWHCSESKWWCILLLASNLKIQHPWGWSIRRAT